MLEEKFDAICFHSARIFRFESFAHSETLRLIVYLFVKACTQNDSFSKNSQLVEGNNGNSRELIYYTLLYLFKQTYTILSVLSLSLSPPPPVKIPLCRKQKNVCLCKKPFHYLNLFVELMNDENILRQSNHNQE